MQILDSRGQALTDSRALVVLDSRYTPDLSKAVVVALVKPWRFRDPGVIRRPG